MRHARTGDGSEIIRGPRSGSADDAPGSLKTAVLLAMVFPALAALMFSGCGRPHPPAVVVYTSQDQVYAEPVLREFTQRTGIPVRAVYDSEAVKTVGLANRLWAERRHPQCDLFWNNEELRTRQLAAQGIFRETKAWKAMGYRSRRLVMNTNLISRTAAPRSYLDLTNVVWRGKLALAYPLFGTTATHFLAWRFHWGETNWLEWCRQLLANQPLLLDGNSVVVQLVGRGEAALGMTDSDDIAAGLKQGLPIAALELMPESLLIPNTVAVVRQSPNPDGAQQLFEYLTQPETVRRLVQLDALEGADAAAVSQPSLQVDWPPLLAGLEPAIGQLKGLFLR